tara:strand:- start:3990 stop:4850 length:861 start_codon:yes stop_codon:yes gene_type:complete
MQNRTLLSKLVKEILTEAELTPGQEIVMQNLGKKYEAFVTTMSDDAGDEKVRAALKAGLQDGDIEDDKIAIKEVTVAVKDLRPTQNEIDIEKSLNYPLEIDSKLLKDYLVGKNVVIMAPIITLNAKWVIDGHHRWSQVYAFNANATMKCANLVFPGLDPIHGLKAVQTAIAAVMGEIPQKSVDGTNLLKASEEKVKSDIVRMISSGAVGQKALEWLKKFNKIRNNEGPNEAAAYIWQQIEVMQTKAKPAAGAPKRGFMPQTDEPPGQMPKLAQLLKKGVVNWNDPF